MTKTLPENYVFAPKAFPPVEDIISYHDCAYYWRLLGERIPRGSLVDILRSTVVDYCQRFEVPEGFEDVDSVLRHVLHEYFVLNGEVDRRQTPANQDIKVPF